MEIQYDTCDSYDENVCSVKRLTKAEYTRYLKNIAVRLSEDENTPADILNLQIIDCFKTTSNNCTEYHFIYSYRGVKYFVIFDNLGIKKIEFPKDKTIFAKKRNNERKFLIYFIISIIFFGVLGSIIDVGIAAILGVSTVLLLLCKTLRSNNAIIEKLRAIKKERLTKFLFENNLDTNDNEQ